MCASRLVRRVRQLTTTCDTTICYTDTRFKHMSWEAKCNQINTCKVRGRRALAQPAIYVVCVCMSARVPTLRRAQILKMRDMWRVRTAGMPTMLPNWRWRLRVTVGPEFIVPGRPELSQPALQLGVHGMGWLQLRLGTSLRYRAELGQGRLPQELWPLHSVKGCKTVTGSAIGSARER